MKVFRRKAATQAQSDPVRAKVKEIYDALDVEGYREEIFPSKPFFEAVLEFLTDIARGEFEIQWIEFDNKTTQVYVEFIVPEPSLAA